MPVFAFPIVATNVCTLSHPEAFVKVWSYDPDKVIDCPFQINSSQANSALEFELDRLIVKFSVAVESHPLEFVDANV